ncbi:MAG: aldo/keto reductase [Eubacteriales bacterium]|nr:aldo/keto reductase [Eubacteriales bacterium]
MNYVPFGKTGENVSRLGFGTMRLPVLPAKPGEAAPVDEQEAIKMIRSAIDGGVSYIDTAYIYHNGTSETITGNALKNGYREKVLLTTKLPVWLVEEEKQMDELLDEQLKRLDVPYLDFYLLHSLSLDSFRKMQSFNYKKFLERALKDGRIRHTGFSFHDDKNAFKEIIDDYDWDMAQIQFNYLDVDAQATVEGLKYAGEKQVPIVVMEPLRGGVLANPPKQIAEMMSSNARKYSPAEWAFHFVGNFSEVATILSGMSTQEQVDDNLRIFKSVKSNSLSQEDLKFVEELKAAYQRRTAIACTNCKYCQPCPQGVAIPRIFEVFNEAYKFESTERLRWHYKSIVKDKQDASLCVEC